MRREETSEEEEKDEDVLSSLPDEIIGHIFSFLSIKDILRTSAVSKRWRPLWTSTTSFSYTCRSINSSYVYPYHRITYGIEFPGLCSSVDRAFSQCSLLRFCIKGVLYEHPRERVLDSWLRSVVTRQLPDVTLLVEYGERYHGRPMYQLPLFFFTYPSLVTLQLHSCFFTLCRGHVSWDSLKVLRVGNVEMTDGLLGVVFDGSPSLESLELVRCWGMNHIQLDSRKLRALTIDGYFDPFYNKRRAVRSEDVDHDDGLTLDVSAPHLFSLQILGEWYGKKEVRLHQVFSLVQAKLDIKLRNLQDQSFTSLLRALSSVNSLMIGTTILKSFVMSIEELTPPLCLRCRTLILGDSAQGSNLLGLKLLLGCTKVQKLVVYFNWLKFRYEDVGHSYKEIYGQPTSRRKSPQKPWANHLKIIEMNGFRALPHEKAQCELLIIEFLLREVVVMEKMAINVRGYCKKEELESLVLGFPRGNKASEIIFKYSCK